MGDCVSKLSAEERAFLRKERENDRKLERQLRAYHEREQQTVKVLLLGAGESGKSTVFKQMILIHGAGFPTHYRMTFQSVVALNVVQSMQTLLYYADVFASPTYKLGTQIDEAVEPAKALIQGIRVRDVHEALSPEVGNAIAALWKDPAIQITYAHSSRFQLIDSADYFFERIHEVCQPNYIPTEADVLRARMRTTAVVEETFMLGNDKFLFVDVGGQRNERRKWINCFSNVTCVLYVASLSGYFQVLLEEEKVNRLDESLALFEEVSTLQEFRKIPVILFLNKRDIFERKFPQVDLEDYFPEYEEYLNVTQQGRTIESGIKFITAKFAAVAKQARREIYPHVTCATDTDMMQKVFKSVREIIVRRNLRAGGLLKQLE